MKNYQILSDDTYITGVEIAYYFVCKRKLWLFAKNISMEQNSELVELGKILHEYSYQNRKKEINLGNIKIDIFKKKDLLISEIKKSRKLENAHIWQMKYYIHELKKRGLNVKKGELLYPLLRKKVSVELEKDDEKEIAKIIKKINKIKLSKQIPKLIDSKICKKCSYYELCYA